MEKKEVVEQSFSICPRCGQKMFYFINNMQLAIPSRSGAFIQGIMNEETDITAVCGKCGAKFKLVNTLMGIATPEYAEAHNMIYSDKEKSRVKEIGYVVDNKGEKHND